MSGRLSRIYRGDTQIDFIGRRRTWFAISTFVLLVSIVALFFRPTDTPCESLPTKGLNCGIEFNGGIEITAPIPDNGPLGNTADLDVIEEVRAAVADVSDESSQVQVAEAEGDRNVIVQTTQVSDEEQRGEIVGSVADATGATVEETSSQSISASFGGEITSKAIQALLVFFAVVLVFISWRFEWKMAVAALAALFHDLIITAGVYAIVGFEVTPSTVIAILTILGYSLYDTVVVFDKVEENTNALAATGRTTYEAAANLALNQVFMRSLNTSLATLLPVAALLFVGVGLFGAGTLEDLALALLVGLLVGAYSSIFVATPILSIVKEREPKYRGVRQRVLRDAKRAPAEPRQAEVPAAVGARPSGAIEAGQIDGAPAGRTSAGKPGSGAGPATRARPGSKKAKRRRKR